jgi:glycosyltransferase involved in cell wall biosynthesis
MQNNKCILLITSSYPASGNDLRAAAGVFVRDFAKNLAQKATVIVLTQRTSKHEQPSTNEDGILVIRFPWRGGETPLSTISFPKDTLLILSVIFQGLWSLLKLRHKFKIDYALAFWTIPSGFWALCLKWFFKIPYSVWCLGSDIWDYKNNFITRHMLKLIFNQAHLLFADGYNLKRDVELISGKTCYFLPTSRCLPERVLIHAEIRQGKNNYLFIGRYHQNKGPDILLEAISLLEPFIREKVHFHFFGGGQIKESLKEFIKSKLLNDIVTLNDYIDEQHAVAYLKACNALIIPSRIESIPVVLSDALQTNCPIIATDVGDMGFLLRHYNAGMVVPPESPEEIAKAIASDVIERRDYSIGRNKLFEVFNLAKATDIFFSHIINKI